jgi:hypothetical protein
MVGAVDEAVEYLPTKCEALSSNPSAALPPKNLFFVKNFASTFSLTSSITHYYYHFIIIFNMHSSFLIAIVHYFF